jgi:hypothetical protein
VTSGKRSVTAGVAGRHGVPLQAQAVVSRSIGRPKRSAGRVTNQRTQPRAPVPDCRALSNCAVLTDRLRVGTYENGGVGPPGPWEVSLLAAGSSKRVRDGASVDEGFDEFGDGTRSGWTSPTTQHRARRTGGNFTRSRRAVRLLLGLSRSHGAVPLVQ